MEEVILSAEFLACSSVLIDSQMTGVMEGSESPSLDDSCIATYAANDE